jgi:hypothetical protein
VSSLKLYGWNTGIQVISVALALKKYAGLDLAAAKKVTDDILDGKERQISLDSDGSARELLSTLVQLGVKAEVIQNPT